ncbi:hypothetical protein VR45_28945 [Streptomyces sp. NRRL S-495]|nr:hypothetical protein VR45_28945 [Streptomyces sp. NRRL S-495]
MFISVQWIVDTRYSSWSNVQGHEETSTRSRANGPCCSTGACVGQVDGPTMNSIDRRSRCYR